MFVNVYFVFEYNLEIILVINKIDFLSVRFEEVKKEIEDVIGFDVLDVLFILVKMGINIEEVLERIVRDILFLKGDDIKLFKVLIFDLFYDNYKGVLVYVRVFDGVVKLNMIIKMMLIGV